MQYKCPYIQMSVEVLVLITIIVHNKTPESKCSWQSTDISSIIFNTMLVFLKRVQIKLTEYVRRSAQCRFARPAASKCNN